MNKITTRLASFPTAMGDFTNDTATELSENGYYFDDYLRSIICYNCTEIFPHHDSFCFIPRTIRILNDWPKDNNNDLKCRLSSFLKNGWQQSSQDCLSPDELAIGGFQCKNDYLWCSECDTIVYNDIAFENIFSYHRRLNPTCRNVTGIILNSPPF